jgi:hypothetical protein
LTVGSYVNACDVANRTAFTAARVSDGIVWIIPLAQAPSNRGWGAVLRIDNKRQRTLDPMFAR